MTLTDSPARRERGNSRLLGLSRPSEHTACFAAYKPKLMLERPRSCLFFLFLASLFGLVYNIKYSKSK